MLRVLDKKLQTLVQQLYSMTMQGKLQWERTANKQTYLTAFSSSTIRLQQLSRSLMRLPDASEHDIELTIRNASGEVVETISLSELEQWKKGETAQALEELFKYLRRQFGDLNREQVIDDLLRELAQAANGQPQSK